MRDSNGSNIQVTVMNDRSQGGSADLSEKATIELMQQRRHTTKDDQTGEPLNDLAPGGINGAKVNAQYNIQIFNFEKGQSKQREQQAKIDQPLQYLFAFDIDIFKPKEGMSLAQHKSPSFDETVQYQAFPLQKGQILVRVENIQDRFDKTAVS